MYAFSQTFSVSFIVAVAVLELCNLINYPKMNLTGCNFAANKLGIWAQTRSVVIVTSHQSTPSTFEGSLQCYFKLVLFIQTSLRLYIVYATVLHTPPPPHHGLIVTDSSVSAAFHHQLPPAAAPGSGLCGVNF